MNSISIPEHCLIASWRYSFVVTLFTGNGPSLFSVPSEDFQASIVEMKGNQRRQEGQTCFCVLILNCRSIKTKATQLQYWIKPIPCVSQSFNFLCKVDSNNPIQIENCLGKARLMCFIGHNSLYLFTNQILFFPSKLLCRRIVDSASSSRKCVNL